MTPPALQECMRRVMTLQFKEEPPYDYIMDCLWSSLEQAVIEQSFGDPASGSDLVKNYAFEWNRTAANRFKRILRSEVSEANDEAEEVKSNEKSS